ncbi:hypothetical protein TNCV_728011 [Trichonephila clavipes]|nr:hypothetical protein TNCV_728011 [Trichonephila clavipes]
MKEFALDTSRKRESIWRPRSLLMRKPITFTPNGNELGQLKRDNTSFAKEERINWLSLTFESPQTVVVRPIHFSCNYLFKWGGRSRVSRSQLFFFLSSREERHLVPSPASLPPATSLFVLMSPAVCWTSPGSPDE